MGIVYFANYFKFCERARSEIFFSQELSPSIGNSNFVVVSTEAKFIASASLGDILNIDTKLQDIRNVSIVLAQNIYKNGIIIFESSVKLGYLKDGKLRRIDDNIKNIFKGFLC